MPRAKRTLAEADPNANTASAKKRATTKAANNKGDEEPVKATAPRKNPNRAQWVITKTHGPKKGATTKKGTSAAAKKATTTAGGNATKKSATDKKDEAASKDNATTKDNAAKKRAPAKSKDPSSVKWITMCRPRWDRRDEIEDEGDVGDEIEDVDEDFDENVEEGCGNKDCKCGKPLAEIPTHPWRFTEFGWENLNKLHVEMMKRDQDMHGLYIYNDFTGYGYQEVFENWLVAFNKEVSKKRPSPVAVWANLEALGMILNGADIGIWMMSDDGQTLTETVVLFGSALLTGLCALLTKGLLKSNSPIVNIPLVVSLFLSFAATWEESDQGQGETGWKIAAVSILKKAGIEFEDGQVVYKTEDRLEAILREIDDYEAGEEKEIGEDGWSPENDQEDEVRQWKQWNWQVEFDLFVDEHAKFPGGIFSRAKKPSIGGTQYDITKFTKAEKERYDLSRGADEHFA
ncbi:MAG: hypothetical protein M1816_000286 [Peltula sp. TS41687]|nr:MAG: hypothetical protein M1816_000286 [Peltula sp. TS41687]